MSNVDMDGDLLEGIKSPDFDCFKCIFELSKHGNNIGIQFVLVEKLATFPYSELEFFIPQLIQILVSFETESMALHDLILNLSRRYPHFCLLAFWNLQAYVFELKGQPDSYSFHVVRSFVNNLQDIMFNQEHDEGRNVMLRENFHPAMIICAAVGASLGMPNIHQYSKPLIISQGKQQKSFLFKLANFHNTLTKNLTLKNRGKREYIDSVDFESREDLDHGELVINQQRYSESVLGDTRNSSGGFDSDIDEAYYNSDYSQDHKIQRSKTLHPKRPIIQRTKTAGQSSTEVPSAPMSDKIVSRSMPNLFGDEFSAEYMPVSLKSESSLQIIGLSELSIINNALLPSQIDIPQLFPASSSPNKRYHRILKLNITEACVLNSAERVPYLLLIEYLSEDMDFDPSTDANRKILSNSESNEEFNSDGVEQENSKHMAPGDNKQDNEADLGDISVIALSNQKSHFSDYLRANMTKDMSLGSTSISRSLSSVQKFPNKSWDPTSSASSGKTRDLSAQIRIAAVMLKQLEKSGQANSEQSAAIKSRIISSMEVLQNQFESIDYQQIREISAVNDGTSEQDAGERKIENDFKIGEDWATKRARIRKTSAFGHLPNWDLCSVIVKNGDDLQQEAFACQLISVISNVWKKDKVGAWTKNMKIVITSFNSGLVETINNALSVHSIKKTMTELSIKSGENTKGTVASIKDYFKKIYGAENDAKYKKAQECFARSLAAYSIICYVLQIKDRHNGNIMLDNEGHIIHIDFGFILSNSPGSVGFEAAPFKLTAEYIEVLGGLQSRFFRLFVDLCKECFLSLREQHIHLVNLVELMQKDSSLPCFKNGPQTTVLLKQRLQLDLSDDECRNFVEATLIGRSAGSVDKVFEAYFKYLASLDNFYLEDYAKRQPSPRYSMVSYQKSCASTYGKKAVKRNPEFKIVKFKAKHARKPMNFNNSVFGLKVQDVMNIPSRNS
ncbi:hypothetical protein JCM33374_g590 [Metschnikowia sp. JCM 33374]|nr:hypothetical protein JCM33374_g590 [Metschnikowia sp. JCM 33374]